jgi:hypothetical protein
MDKSLVRFPCGHLEDQPSATARTRETSRVAWISCRSCNVVALTISSASVEASSRQRRSRPVPIGADGR